MNSGKISSIGSVCRKWWLETFSSDTGVARATRAHLKRCVTPQDALAVDATHDLLRRIQTEAPSCCRNRKAENLAEKAGIIAVIVASIKDSESKTLPRLLGQIPKNSGSSVMSKTRFERLMRTKEPKELIAAMRRSIEFSPTPNVAALAEHLFYWGTDGTSIKWWLDYFGTSDSIITGKEN